MKKYAMLLTIIIIFFLGILTDRFFWQPKRATNQIVADYPKTSQCNATFPFLSLLIDCGNIDERVDQISEINQKTQQLAEVEKNLGNASVISIFFRDLKTTKWFGVNENERFYPASLGKLPLSMMYYKIAEVQSNLLTSNITINETYKNANAGQPYLPIQKIETGKAYPISELLRFMLVYSDNVPLESLAEGVKNFREPILTDLGIYISTENDSLGDWNFTAKTYANLFRLLYNSSYLKPEYSNIILDYLSQSQFKNGLVADIPSDVRIAHKFGVMIPHQNNSEYILSDCGIIYKKDNPYILCVMTRGKDLNQLESIIGRISETVYKIN